MKEHRKHFEQTSFRNFEAVTQHATYLVLSIIKNPVQFRLKQTSLLNSCLSHLFAEKSNTGLQLTAIYLDSKDSPYANLDRVQCGMNSSRDSISVRCL